MINDMNIKEFFSNSDISLSFWTESPWGPFVCQMTPINNNIEL